MFPIAPSLVMVGWSVGQKKKEKRLNTWRGLGSREGRAAKQESLYHVQTAFLKRSIDVN